MAFRRLISASQGSRVTVQTISSADTAMLPQAVTVSCLYLFALESQRSNLLLYRRGVGLVDSWELTAPYGGIAFV